MNIIKRITALVLAIIVLSVTASAGELLIAPNPFVDGSRPDNELIQSLAKGIIPITDDLTYEDFLIYMRIIDESDNKILTSKFETLVYVISLYFYDPLTEEEVFERFAEVTDEVDINDMDTHYRTLFSVLDRFSYYLTPEEAVDFFTPTSSKGIGIKMVWSDASETREAGTYVDEVAVGSSAEEAGIKIGDRIVEFNGFDMRGLGFDALTVYSTSVPSDSETLSLTLERDGTETSYTLERRENIFAEYRMTLYPEKELIVLDIDSFMYPMTATDISTDIDVAVSMGYKDVIIDLRGNSGGDVYVASSIISKFIPDERVLFYMGREERFNTLPIYSDGNGYTFDNIRVLTDGATASSAEITADTLQKLCGARIIGEKSFGKGVAQSAFSFEDGAVIGITTYVAYDTNGETYNENGITPDFTVYPVIEKSALPASTPCFTYLNYKEASDGNTNETVRGLEIRLEALGFLSEGKVDGSWDSSTANAISAFQIANGFETTGALNDETYFAIIDAIREYEQTYYVTYTSFDYAYRFS